MTPLDLTTLTLSGPLARGVPGPPGPPGPPGSPGSPGPGGIPPRVPAAGGLLGSRVPAAGNSPRPGDRAACLPPACRRAALAPLRPPRGAGVLIRLLRCIGFAGALSLDGIGFGSGVGGIGPGSPRPAHPTPLAPPAPS